VGTFFETQRRTLCYVNIDGSYKLLKTIRFSGPPCISIFYDAIKTKWSRSGWPGFWSGFISRSVQCAHEITSLCVQELWFVPPWLTSRQTECF